MKVIVGILSLSFLLGPGPCKASVASRPGHGKSAARSRSVESVTAALRRAGFRVRAADKISQPFFSVPARVLVVEDEDLQVYQFRSFAAAGVDAAKIAPSGSPIGTSMPNWMVPPHIYRKDNLILVYLGTNPRVRSTLEAQVGPQIAGAR